MYELLRQIVKLQIVITHSVHILRILRIGLLLPYLLTLSTQSIDEVDLVTPLTFYSVSYLARSREDSTGHTEIRVLRPAAPGEL